MSKPGRLVYAGSTMRLTSAHLHCFESLSPDVEPWVQTKTDPAMSKHISEIKILQQLKECELQTSAERAALKDKTHQRILGLFDPAENQSLGVASMRYLFLRDQINARSPRARRT